MAEREFLLEYQPEKAGRRGTSFLFAIGKFGQFAMLRVIVRCGTSFLILFAGILLGIGAHANIPKHLLSSGLPAASVLDTHDCSYDLAGQRHIQTRTDASLVQYFYDPIGQLTGIWDVDFVSGIRRNDFMGYAYDAAGNLLYRKNLALVQSFQTDNLNQLTTLTRSGTFAVTGNTSTTATNVTVNGTNAYLYTDTTFAKDGFTLTNGVNSYTVVAKTAAGKNATNTISVDLPATNTFAYDLNGNLRTNGAQIFDYDDENRLVTNWVPTAWKIENVYDAFSRRRITRGYGWSGISWVKTNETHYVCDGMLPIQERDENNYPTTTITRGLDLSGSLSGAGGIGGLLARTDFRGSAFYHSDAGGNVTAMVDAHGGLAAWYLYDPFGRMNGTRQPRQLLCHEIFRWHTFSITNPSPTKGSSSTSD